MAELTGGVAFLETFAAEDEFDGDHEGFHARPARWYRRTLARHGLQRWGRTAGSARPGRRCRRAGTDVNPDSLFSGNLTCGTPDGICCAATYDHTYSVVMLYQLHELTRNLLAPWCAGPGQRRSSPTRATGGRRCRVPMPGGGQRVVPSHRQGLRSPSGINEIEVEGERVPIVVHEK